MSGKRRTAMCAVAGLVLTMTAGCYRRHQDSDEEIRAKAQQATEQARKEAKQVTANAKVAAAEASRRLAAVAAGVKDGLRNDDGKVQRVDINAASKDDLTALPGVNRAWAQAIIDGRPYDTGRDLVRKGILSKAQYDRISARIVVK